jgi:hypothetical protein
MKKIIILLSIFFLGSASAGNATPMPHSGIYATNLNLSDWTFNGDDDPIPSAKALKAIQLWDFWNYKYAFLNADANKFLWKLNMRGVSLHKNPLKDKKIQRKIVKAIKGMDLPIDSSFEGDSYVELMTTGTLIDDANTSPIPEPAAMLIFGTGLVGLAVTTRRKLFHKR